MHTSGVCMDWERLDDQIRILDETVTDALSGARANWGDIWRSIKEIGAAFRESRYPSRDAKNDSWNRFQDIVTRVKKQQEEHAQRQQEGAAKAAELDQQLAALEALIASTTATKGQWKPVWDEIRRINSDFKGVHFPSRSAREAAWNRFQQACTNAKASQNAIHQEREAFARESEKHKYEILGYASSAMPMNGLESAAYVLSGMALVEGVVTKVVNLLPGPDVDPVRNALEARSQALREGRRLLSVHKGDMKRKDKDEAWESLNTAAELLERDWAEWKRGRSEAFEQARQQRDQKREEWQGRVRSRISGLEERLARLENAEAKIEANIEKLRDMESSARSDDHRERVSGWRDEAEQSLSEIRSKISQIRGWITEEYQKLA